MAGNRATDPVPVDIAPGFLANEDERDAVNRYSSGNRVRFHLGRPEKMKGWVRQALTGAAGGRYVGVNRALHDWSSLDTQFWIALGTNCKLYLVNNAVLSDITPLRKASTVHDPIQTFVSSSSITIHDPDHRADVGDHIRVYSATAVGGVTVDGDYDIATVIDPDSYTIVAGVVASGNATGGGDVTIEYDIGCGLAENGELLGYGTGNYGVGTYGTPRVAGTGVPARLRTWSLDNWGEDLIASPSDGEIYWWDRSNGAGARATLLENAPTGVQRIVVSPENRFLIAIGCSGLDGQFDPMRVRWCAQEDFNTWIPDINNTAGGKRLDYGSRLITGLKSGQVILLWSDTQLYAMQYVGGADIFGFDPKGTVHIAGPNAAGDVNGVAYFMCLNNFAVYDGTLRTLPCEVWRNVFDDSLPDSIDKTQIEKVHCFTFQEKSEITWRWPSKVGGGEVDRYTTYNYLDQCWYDGFLTRSAMHESTDAIAGYRDRPYATQDGYLYVHETGTDEIEGVTTNVMDWFLQTWDMSVGGSSKFVLLTQLIPSFKRFTGSMQVTVKTKRKPRGAYRDKGPYPVTTVDEMIDVRARGSQFALRFENGLDGVDPQAGTDFRMGIWQAQGTPYGGR